MNRREFLKFGGCGLAAVAVGGAGGTALFGARAAVAATATLDLTLVEVDHEMVDGVRVKAWAYKTSLVAGTAALGARIPGPAIFVNEGDTIRVLVRNEISKGGPHGFAIPGVVDTGPLALDEQVEVEFAAPKPGTYLYFDPLNGPVNRVMGLYGVLVVMPAPVGRRTPYADPTPSVTRLFDDLGTAAHFPGHYWDRDRNAIWAFCTVDPDKHADAYVGSDAPGSGISPAAFQDGYLPQYFTINGASGFFAAQHGHAAAPNGSHGHSAPSPDLQSAISIHGNVGQPVLIRNVNAGLMWHSPHIHGNHVYRLSNNGTVHGHLEFVDTWTMPPLESCDVLLPYIAPPDIPANFWERAAADLNDELFPLVFPMHDHNEISNTAAGGNYPQGLVTHFEIHGPPSPADAVLQIDRAEVRVRTGQILVEGRFSGPACSELGIHAGVDGAGPGVGRVTVGADGTFSFRGRALKALASRKITLHHHDSGVERAAIPLTLR